MITQALYRTPLAFLRTRLSPAPIPRPANEDHGLRRHRAGQLRRLNLRAAQFGDIAQKARMATDAQPVECRAFLARRVEAARYRADAYEALAEAVECRVSGDAFGLTVALQDWRQCRRSERLCKGMAWALERAL